MIDRPIARIPNALEVEHLTVRLAGREILHDLTFDVAHGATIAVIGPNGAGKSVLFRALIGVLPFTGQVRWAQGTRIGYVPQKLDLERDLPVSGHDLLSARAHIGKASAAAIARAIARVGLDNDVLGRPIGIFSGGQFQRLLMACALLGAPTALLLDEPTAGIDEPGQERINETVHRLQREDGATVFFISHDLSVVTRFATHVLCLTREHTCFGVPRQALTPDVLTRLYGEPIGLFIHDHPAG